jgi:hypothetical protein
VSNYGICTRQLPQLIVFIYWPNAQNLEGLSAIVRELDMQEHITKLPIERIFVPSNLPTLDDKDGILRELLVKFRAQLHYRPSQEVSILNYPSLDLLRQELLTVVHANSRLAREYKRLADKILTQNLDLASDWPLLQIGGNPGEIARNRPRT